MKTKLARIAVEMDDYLADISKRTGVPKSQCSRLLANSLKDNELKLINNNRKMGFRFDLKI